MADPLSGSAWSGNHYKLWLAGGGTQSVVSRVTDSGRKITIPTGCRSFGGDMVFDKLVAVELQGRWCAPLSPGAYAGFVTACARRLSGRGRVGSGGVGAARRLRRGAQEALNFSAAGLGHIAVGFERSQVRGYMVEKKVSKMSAGVEAYLRRPCRR